jgi:hypothetical protein
MPRRRRAAAFALAGTVFPEIVMTRPLSLLAGLLLVAAGTLSAPCQAQESMFEIDAKFRARIQKEKAKQATHQRSNQQDRGGTANDVQCGSQNIGNIDTGGRIGAMPREVFVFAPNAINFVDGSGCR